LFLSTWSNKSRVFLKLNWIELNCKEGMKMYVDGDRVVTTVSM
jgi:hypothetical protein